MDKLSSYFIKFLKWVFLPLIILFVILETYQIGVKMGWISLLIHFAFAILMSLSIFGVMYFMIEILPRINSKLAKPMKAINPLNWKITLIFAHMIKAWYTKACPLVTWEGENKKEIEEINTY